MNITAQQADLRAYIVLPRMPEGCVSHVIPDSRAEPHFHVGDIAIVDPDNRTPDHGDMFLIEWSNGGRQVVEIRRFPKPEAIVGWNGVDEYWRLHWKAALTSIDGGKSKVVDWGDGPYSTAHLAPKIVGCVVGILQPAYEEPMRVAA